MRMKLLASLFVGALLFVSTPAAAQSGADFASNCKAWVTALRGARRRPPLQLWVEETMTRRRSPHDPAQVRRTAEDAYERYGDIRADFTNVEDYVRFALEAETAEPLEYTYHYQYRITVTSNRFHVVSSNRMERFFDHYHAISGTKSGLLYNAVREDIREDGRAVRLRTRDQYPFYTDFLQYGCCDNEDLGVLQWGWQIVSDEPGQSLWDRLCASNALPLEAVAKGAVVRINEDVFDSCEVIRMENATGDGRGGQILMVDKSDGRKLLMEDTWNV